MTGLRRASWTTVVAVLGALVLAVPGAAQAQVPYPLDCEDLGSSKVTTPGPFKALPQEVVEVPSSIDGRPRTRGPHPGSRPPPATRT